nr:uncharacterized protein LOC111416728 isoform X2 [Onthophagus taurus]
MPMCCSVSSCKMTHVLAQDMKKKISFFSFPKETNLKNIWIKRCDRKGTMTAKRPRICSLHFRSEDFKRDLQSELQNLPPKLILKKGALPSLNLGKYNLEECAVETERTENDDSARTTGVPQLKLILLNLHEEVNVSSNTVVTNVEDKDERIILLNAENLRLKKTIMQQQLTINKYRKKINSLQTENRQQKQSISLLKSKHVEKKVQDQFKNIFTPKQLEVILKNKKIVHWQEEDITRAYTIRYFSKNCYNYLRDELHYPLPGISTLQSWAAKLKKTST